MEWGGIEIIFLQYLFRCNASKERLTSIIKLVISIFLDQSTTAIIKI